MKALKSPFIDGHPEGSGALAALADLIALRHRATQCTLPVNRIATNPMSGQLRSTQQGRGIDFSEVRLYQPGDDVRSIDWKVTARTSKTHTKIFQEERERPVMILVDQGPSLFWNPNSLQIRRRRPLGSPFRLGCAGSRRPGWRHCL